MTNIQDHFLNQVRIKKIQGTIFLVNGFQIRGVILGYDKYVVMVESEGKQQVIFKSAISTFAPLNSVELPSEE